MWPTRRVTANVTKTTSYAYNQDGSVKSITYPSTRTINYTYSGAARMLSAVDSTGPVNYVTSATYAPPGELRTYTDGFVSGGFAGITTANTYNSRLQPVLISSTSPTASIFSLCYDFHSKTAINLPPCPFSASATGDNGDVFQIVNNRDGNRTQNFLYDSLDRIQQAYTNGANWGETFSSTATAPGVPPSSPGIDAWGNLTNRSGVTGKTNYEAMNCPANTNNQLTACSLGYDAAGNVTSNGSATFNYNQENRLTKFVTTTTDIYVYDGDGRRVKRNIGAVTLYWYDTSGNVIDETNGSGALTAEYVYFNGKRVARRDADNSVHYYFADTLGSASVIAGVVNNAAVIQDESDYYPYGGEMPITNNDPNHYKFTGKERDSESGLDMFGARYYGSSLGRFMTPDLDNDPDEPGPIPYADLRDPQTLNLYSYVRNNPLNRIDPDGHKLVCTNSSSTDENGNIHVIVDCHEEPDPPPPPPPSIIDQVRSLFFSDVSDPADKRAIIGSIVNNVVSGNGNSGNLNDFLPSVATNTSTPPPPTIPLKALKVLDAIDASSSAGPNIQGGKTFQNREGKLPPTDGHGNAIQYKEWDVNAKQAGVGRGTERVVTGSDGSAYYTSDHYQTFQKVR